MPEGKSGNALEEEKMKNISIEEMFDGNPMFAELAKGILSFLHLKKLPRVQDKVDAIVERLEIMSGVVGSLTEMFSGDFSEIETQFGKKTNRCKTTHILIDEGLLDQILFTKLEVIVILMWKQLHVDEPFDASALEEKLLACRKAWGPLCDVLIDRTEGADAALRLKEEVSDFMDSLMFVLYANKVTDDLADFLRHREKIKTTLREITSALIKVEAKKPKPKEKTPKTKPAKAKKGLKGPKTSYQDKQVEIFAAYVKDHPITASVKAGQRARACWIAHKDEWDKAAADGTGYSKASSLARAYRNRRIKS